jgi:hypothetical protein
VIRFLAVMLALGTGLLHAEPNEKGLWQVWELHTAQPADHAAIIAACIGFSKLDPKDPLVPVSTTLAAWHLLAMDKPADAAKLLTLYASLGGSTLNEGVADMARAWLTRLDRQRVREALQFHYRKEVRYPRTLKELAEFAALPAELQGPATDRYGQPWKYKLAGFKTIPGLLDQKYELTSAKLGIDSDLEETMAWPYATRIRMVPVKAMPNGIEMNRGPFGIEGPQDTFVMGTGQKVDGVTLVYIGRNLLILTDRDHWQVLRKPQ